MILQPVILCGGSGSRLWPLSRQEYPKHVIPLLDQQSLLQKTLMRLEGLSGGEAISLICHENHRFMVAEQCLQLRAQVDSIVVEPCARNTAPAVAVAAIRAARVDPETVLLVLPADHMIQDAQVFQRTIEAAMPFAIEGKLVTFGIVPDRAHTGYGYIHRGKALDGAYQVESFVEKPDSAAAQRYLNSGEYSWNSGVFLFQADAYLEELRRFQPEMLKACEEAVAAEQVDTDFVRLGGDAFAQAADISIDYAVMEKTKEAVVVLMDAGWSDVGSWESVADISEADQQGNVAQGDVLTENVKNCYLRAENRLLAVAGLDNHIVIETADAVLVAEKGAGQQVKDLVKRLEAQGRYEPFHHRRQYRTWGYHELLVQQADFQVRRVYIKPGHEIPRQKHNKRSEHWVVVKGVATIEWGVRQQQLQENESWFVPMSTPHSVGNATENALEFIEVQLGTSLKDDNIEV